MIQVYCNSEDKVNQFLLKNNNKIEVISTQLAINEKGELIMVTYKINHGEDPSDIR